MMSFIIEGSGSSSGLFQVKQIPSQQGAAPAHFKCWIGRGLELWYIAYKVVGGLRQASTVRSHLRVHNIIWKRLSSLRHKEAAVQLTMWSNLFWNSIPIFISQRLHFVCSRIGSFQCLTNRIRIMLGIHIAQNNLNGFAFFVFQGYHVIFWRFFPTFNNVCPMYFLSLNDIYLSLNFVFIAFIARISWFDSLLKNNLKLCTLALLSKFFSLCYSFNPRKGRFSRKIKIHEQFVSVTLMCSS